jgi:hypothetical protein
MSVPVCRNCSGSRVEILIDFGSQPPSNRFVPVGQAVADTHALRFAQCADCGLFQLADPMPPAVVKSRHQWLTYNEPEGHLDALVRHLTGLPGITPASRIAGLTYKDDSTLARFNRLGYDNTFRYDLAADFGVADPCAGLETIQSVVDHALADALAAKHGRADILLVRHVLEHAHDPAGFLDALGRLLAPGGRAVFEMPDCRKFVEACDYSFVWEEHITYFSPRTAADFLRRHGFHTAGLLVYPYSLEDSLVVVAERGAVDVEKPEETLEADRAAGRRFAAALAPARQAFRAQLEALRGRGQHIALFGAGHLAAKFLNLYGLKDCVDAVIDDNPNKQGLSMPGSGLPIIDSAALPQYQLCILSLSPESEQKVLARQQAYVAGGGRFASIFALSPLALPRV